MSRCVCVFSKNDLGAFFFYVFFFKKIKLRYADCDAIGHWGSTRRLVVKLKCLTVRHSVLTFTFLSWLVGDGHQECTSVESLLARMALLYGTSVEQLTSTYINWPINYSSRPGQGYLRSLDIADLLSHTDSMYVTFV